MERGSAHRSLTYIHTEHTHTIHTHLVCVHGGQHSGAALVPRALHTLHRQALCGLALQELAVQLRGLGLVVGGNGLHAFLRLHI